MVAVRDSFRERVVNYGEVFTPPELVNDMLDLVAQECEREDSRFLEPACGDGNFLAEVLRRRLLVADKRHRTQNKWEAHALLGLACLYGIEIQADNTITCRDRLAKLFNDHYRLKFGPKSSDEVYAAARHIARVNIVQGDALKMADPAGEPIVFTQWSLIGRRFKREIYAYDELQPPATTSVGNLFELPSPQLFDEDDKPVFIARHIRTLPLIHYLDVAKEEEA